MTIDVSVSSVGIGSVHVLGATTGDGEAVSGNKKICRDFGFLSSFEVWRIGCVGDQSMDVLAIVVGGH